MILSRGGGPWTVYFRALSYDLYASRRTLLLGGLCFGFLVALSLMLACKDAAQMGIDLADLTLGDRLLCVFAGKAKPEWRPGIVLTPPAGWVLLFMVACYSLSCHPYRDLHTFAFRSYVGIGSRSRWWCSKFIWLSFSVIALWVISIGVCTVFCVGSSAPISFSVTVDGAALSGRILQDIVPSITMSILVALLSSLALMALQFSLSLLLRPVIGFAVSAVLLVSTYFIHHPLIFVNGLMLLRSDLLFEQGLSSAGIAASSCLAICLSFSMGLHGFRKLDFY